MESLSPLERLFLVNELRNYMQTEDSELIPYLVRNPLLLDMIIALQEEVKGILNRPEQLSEGKRDPFHKNYAHEEETSSRDSEKDKSHNDRNGMSQEEESVDFELVKKLTFKELLERERQKENDSNGCEYVSRFVPGEHSGNGNGSSGRLQMLVNKAPTTTFYPAMQQLQLQAQMGADPGLQMGYPQAPVQQPMQYLPQHIQPQAAAPMNGQAYHYMQPQMQAQVQYHQLAPNFAHPPQFAGQMHGFHGYSQMPGYPTMMQGYAPTYYGALPNQQVQGHMIHNPYGQQGSQQAQEAEPGRAYPAYIPQQAEEDPAERLANHFSPNDKASPEKPTAHFAEKPHHRPPPTKPAFQMPPSPFATAPSSNMYQNK